jgi:cbb3-type cytochrome oxidase subunit 3
MDYETIRTYSGLIGLLCFVGVFTVIVLWVFRPGSKKQMDEHAQIPFKEDD